MPNVFRPSSVRRSLIAVAALLIAATAPAQVTAPVTLLNRTLSHLDLGVSGVGEFTNTVTGKVTPTSSSNYGTILTQNPSTTLGALVTIRYTKSPLVGVEFNYGYARYTQNFTVPAGQTYPTGAPVVSPINGGAQTNASEYTVGYIAHTPKILGIGTFVSAGAGSMAFRATPGGGQSLPTQARAAYYYDAGVESSVFSPHFGIRAQFRQVFFLAPDFGQNYLTIKQRQITTEPGIGFYIHF